MPAAGAAARPVWTVLNATAPLPVPPAPAGHCSWPLGAPPCAPCASGAGQQAKGKGGAFQGNEIWDVYSRYMGRQTSPTALGLAGICNVCRRSCITMDQAGSMCWFCGIGLFLPRPFWTQCLCPHCSGIGMCPHCEKGLLVEPVTEPAVLAQLADCLIAVETRYAPDQVSKAAHRWIALGHALAEGRIGPQDLARICFSTVQPDTKQTCQAATGAISSSP